MIEVFKTNVQELFEAEICIYNLLTYFPESKINFDLEDCDKILRIDNQGIVNEKIVDIVNNCGFSCEVLL